MAATTARHCRQTARQRTSTYGARWRRTRSSSSGGSADAVKDADAEEDKVGGAVEDAEDDAVEDAEEDVVEDAEDDAEEDEAAGPADAMVEDADMVLGKVEDVEDSAEDAEEDVEEDVVPGVVPDMVPEVGLGPPSLSPCSPLSLPFALVCNTPLRARTRP